MSYISRDTYDFKKVLGEGTLVLKTKVVDGALSIVKMGTVLIFDRATSAWLVATDAHIPAVTGTTPLASPILAICTEETSISAEAYVPGLRVGTFDKTLVDPSDFSVLEDVFYHLAKNSIHAN